jgi:hypothetical protein
MDQDAVNLLLGVFALLLIVNTTVVWSMAATNSTQPSLLQPLNISAISPFPSNGTANVTNVTKVVTTATAKPKPTKTPTPQPTPTPETFVEIVYATPEVTETHPQVQPVFLRRSEEGYTTLYSINNQTVSEHLPRVIINAKNPPLIVDYVFYPVMVTDVKPLDYKLLKTQYHENLTMSRPYENAWFELNVTDVDSGEIIDSAGVGRYNGLQFDRQLVIEKGGKIAFDLDGQMGNVTLTIRMQKPK